MKTSTVAGMRLVMDYILPLALTERRRHPQTPPGRMSDQGEYCLKMSVTQHRFMYFDLTVDGKDVGGLDISECHNVCRLIADALDEFDACCEYAAARGCELTEIPSTKSYVDRMCSLRIPDPDTRALTASPIDLLADYYLPLFIAEFRDRKDEFVVEVLMNEDPCSCDTLGECGCDYSMSDIMCLPWESNPDEGGSTISGRLVKTIRDTLLADVDESVRRMVACGYDMTVDDPSFRPKTCYIRQRLNPGEFHRPLFGEGRTGGERFPAQFALTFQTNAIPQDDAVVNSGSTSGWTRITPVDTSPRESASTPGREC